MVLDPLFPPETSDQLTTQMQTMDELVRNIQQVLMDLRRFCEDRSDLERRVDELERTVSRLNSTVLDLRGGGLSRSESGDRLLILEQMVARLTRLAEEKQEAPPAPFVPVQKDSLPIDRDDEPVLQEIDDLMRRRS